MKPIDRINASVDHRAVFITGGASGLGLALAKQFGAAGWRVGILDCNDSHISEAVAVLEAQGTRVSAYKADVTTAPDMTGSINDFASSGLGVMINNAGIAAGGDFLLRPLEDWRKVFDVNLMGTVNGCRAAIPHLLQGRSILHNVASAAGFMCSPMMASYNASKAAVVALTESLIGEYAPKGNLRISVSLPAFFPTNLLKTLLASDEEKEIARLLMEHSGYTVEQAAQDILAGIAAEQTYIFAPERLKSLWRFKRLLPGKFLKILPEKRRERIDAYRKLDAVE